VNVATQSQTGHNVADGNGSIGIDVPCPGTVTNNEASGNGVGDYSSLVGCFAKGNS
jgi:hypothetical protein